METLGRSDYFAGITNAHTCLRDLGGCLSNAKCLLIFSGIEEVYDITNPFDSWQLVTVRSNSTTNTAGLV